VFVGHASMVARAIAADGGVVRHRLEAYLVIGLMRGLRYAVPAAVAVVACSGAGAGAAEERVLAVASYDEASFGREIQLIGDDGHRRRIAPHRALPIDGAWSPDGRRIAFSGGDPTSSTGGGYRAIYTSDRRGTDVRLLYEAVRPDDAYSVFLFLPSWSPNGRLLSFSVNGQGPWVVDVKTGRARRLANLAFDGWAAWSPNGRTLAFAGWTKAKGRGIYTVRVDGTRLRRLTRHERNAEAELADVGWSPNGRQIAFARFVAAARFEIEVDVVGADGRGERRIARDSGCPAWSPDGRLAFQGRSGIYVVKGDGTPTLVAARKNASCPVWSADGRRVLFYLRSTRPFAVDADGGSIHRAGLHERFAPHPSQLWSRDGTFLAMDGDFDANWYEVRIESLGGAVTRLSWADDHAPAWSPDGASVAFTRTSDKTDAVYVVTASGGKPRKLGAGANPSWSPDGAAIAFERNRHVFVAPASGGPARDLGAGTTPVWSPDGRSLAVGGQGLRVVPLEGGNARRLDWLRPDCDGHDAATAEGIGQPSWSHGGDTLAFVYYMAGCDTRTLAVTQSDGTNHRDLAETYFDGQPQWSADDKRIIFIDGDDRLVATDLAGSATPLLPDRRVRSFALTPDGALAAAAVGSGRRTEVWLVPLDAGKPRLLVAERSDSDLAWRP
jgi:Tol biopolymer transport system component